MDMIPTDVIIIDDEKDYCNALKTWSRKFGIRITDFQNLEDGIIHLRATPHKFKGLILDARCMKTADQEYEGDDFLLFALDELGKVERDTGRMFPFVVNTGYLDEKTIALYNSKVEEKKSKIFQKTQETKDAMFLFLLDAIGSVEITKIEHQYNDVFTVFEKKYLPEPMRAELHQILKNHEKPSEVLNTLGKIRIVQDEIYNTFERVGILPNRLSFTKKNKYLSGNVDRNNNYQPISTVYQTSTIEYLSSSIYRISSDFGNHAPTQGKALPTIYAAKALTNALLEQLIWFTKLMDDLT